MYRQTIVLVDNGHIHESKYDSDWFPKYSMELCHIYWPTMLLTSFCLPYKMKQIQQKLLDYKILAFQTAVEIAEACELAEADIRSVHCTYMRRAGSK